MAVMSNRTWQVVKVGGSLLEWEGLDGALRRWLAEERPARRIFLVGGGQRVDRIRRRAAEESLADDVAHWLAIDAMSGNSRQFAARFGWPLVESPLGESLVDAENSEGESLVFDARRFLREEEAHAPGRKLPHTWDATSDSIAARMAIDCQAEELVLLKSAPPVAGESFRAAAERGYVDRAFPDFASDVARVRFVDLRSYKE